MYARRRTAPPAVLLLLALVLGPVAARARPDSSRPASAPADVVINEVLVDPASGPDGDANGDGLRDTYQDEFIELVNRGGGPADLSGWQLGAAGGDLFSFPDGTLLPPGGYVTLFGGGDPSGLPGMNMTAGGRIGNGLSNTAGRLLLINPAGPDTLQDIDYLDWDTDSSHVRVPEGGGAFADHLVVHGLRFSPSTPSTADGGPFTSRPAIYRARPVNVTSAGFEIAWRTPTPADGRLEVIVGAMVSHHYDPASAGLLHRAGLYGLPPLTEVGWRVVSAGSGYPADSTLVVSTGPVATTVPYAVYGHLSAAGGAPQGAHVFLRGERAGSVSGWLLAVTDSLGRWHLNLGNLRGMDGSPFAWQPGDSLHLEADGGESGLAASWETVSGSAPQEVPIPILQVDPAPLFEWLDAPVASADTVLTLRYALSDAGGAWARAYLRPDGGTERRFPVTEPAVLGPAADHPVVLPVADLPEGSLWWAGAIAEDGLHPPQAIEAVAPFRIAHASHRTLALSAGVLLFTPTLDDPLLTTASDWLDRLPDTGELAGWDNGSGAWFSIAKAGDGTLVGTDFTLVPGEGYALVSARSGSLSVRGPRRYAPPMTGGTAGLLLRGIADSLSGRSASEVLADPHVVAVSRWDTHRQAWEGLFRAAGGVLGEDFAISWGEAVAVEADSTTSWQPASPALQTPRSAAPRSAGMMRDATQPPALLATVTASGGVELLWRAPPGARLTIQTPDGSELRWVGQSPGDGWLRENTVGLEAGAYHAILESETPVGTGRLVQAFQIASPQLPLWPRWFWGQAPPGGGLLLIESATGRAAAQRADGGAWYAGLPTAADEDGLPGALLLLHEDGGWTRWPLSLASVGGGTVTAMEISGDPISLAGLTVASDQADHITLSWRIHAADSPLVFTPLLGWDGSTSTGAGPPGDPRCWAAAGPALRWVTGEPFFLEMMCEAGALPRSASRAQPEAVAVRVALPDGSVAWLGPVPLPRANPPAGLELLPAAPNPFNPDTMLRFSLPGEGSRRVRLEIVDVRGRRVRTLVDEERAPGLHHVRWDGRDGAGRRVASGVYLVILEADGARRSRKILLLR